MPLIFVTGVSGSGKSTVREELARRGFEAYDTDEDAISQWRHKVTGEITPLVAEAHRTPQFLAENEWWADPERLRGLAREARTRNIFVCGAVTNDDAVLPLFERVFLLSIDEATMRHRLATRSAHDFGTKPHELEVLLAWGAVIDAHYAGLGAIVVDAERPLPLVVDEILLELGGSS